MDPQQPERHFNIQIEPQALAGVYANFANVSHSDYEFTITFARVDHDVEGPDVPGRRGRPRQPRTALHAPVDRRAAGQLFEVVDAAGHQAPAGVRRRRRPRRRVVRRLLRVAVISDVHSNLQALEAVLDHAERRGLRGALVPGRRGRLRRQAERVPGPGARAGRHLPGRQPRSRGRGRARHRPVHLGCRRRGALDAQRARRRTNSKRSPCSRPRASGPACRSSTARSAIRSGSTC